jgi:hypothetical protein
MRNAGIRQALKTLGAASIASSSALSFGLNISRAAEPRGVPEQRAALKAEAGEALLQDLTLLNYRDEGVLCSLIKPAIRSGLHVKAIGRFICPRAVCASYL